MKFMFHGAGQEVGRSCIVLDNRYLLDAGLKITEHGNEYPTHFDPQHIEAAFISHAHLDHTGALPKLNHDGLRCPIFMTKMTRLTTAVLLEDSLHIELISHAHPGYAKKHIMNVLQHVKDIQYNKPKKISNDLTVTFLDAGHIPGSASILLNYKNKKILYTGDINHQTTQLLNGANYNPGKIDVMITESTYGDRTHPNRKESEQEFIELIQETLDNNGSALIPAFAVGRAQEIILLLMNHPEINCPIYLDGMARKITDLYTNNPRFVKDRTALQAAAKRIQHITSRTQRAKVLRENCIIVTTSGMVTGGPIMSYLKMMCMDSSHAILLTGYQAEGTNGRLLLQEGCVYVDGKKLRWEGQIEKFDFSAHAGQQELINAIQQIRPTNLIINHGDDVAIHTLAKKVKRFTKKIYLPEVGQFVNIN
jgi:putative mRNA 3-end processing factor